MPLAVVIGPARDAGDHHVQALPQIASTAQSFYNQPTPGQLNTLYTQVAADIQRGSAGLIDNATP